MALVPQPIKKIIFASTRKGKVEQLERLNKSLQQNTDLVAKEYNKLSLIEENVAETLERLDKEDFEKEMGAIDGLEHLEGDEREAFKKSLVTIKERGIAELKPISQASQKIKAHMLVTLNKALIQRAILEAKTSLAGNACLQLETLQTMNKETKHINVELEKLLEDLDKLNSDAINEYSSIQTEMKEVVHKDGRVTKVRAENVIDHIIGKGEELKKNKGKVKRAKEEIKEEEGAAA